MLTKNSSVLKKGLLSLAIAWTVLIAFLCLVSFNDFPSIGVKSADKYVHVTFHFVFTLLWGLYSRQRNGKVKLRKIIAVVFISIAYGLLIEGLQETITATRHADLLDVLANLTGALLALLLFILVRRKKQTTTTK